MEYLLYKCVDHFGEISKEEMKFEIWKPSLFSIFPEGYPKKYVLFSLFKLFRVFGNSNYAVVVGYIEGNKACSLMIVPKYYKWSFMNKNDVQLIYVITEKNYQGKGLATKMLDFAKSWLVQGSFSGDIWYVTDTSNLASQRLAEKSGFRLVGKGEKVKGFFLQKLIMK